MAEASTNKDLRPARLRKHRSTEVDKEGEFRRIVHGAATHSDWFATEAVGAKHSNTACQNVKKHTHKVYRTRRHVPRVTPSPCTRQQLSHTRMRPVPELLLTSPGCKQVILLGLEQNTRACQESQKAEDYHGSLH